MNIVRDQYNKQTLDNVNLTIEAGAKRLIEVYEDIYAMNIMGVSQLASITLLQELSYRLRDNLLDVCDDMKAFLDRAGANSAFVEQIKDIIRMGGDLIDISVHYRDIIEESGSSEEVIKEVYGEDTSTDDIIEAISDSDENVLIPPVDKADIINTAKETIEQTKEIQPNTKPDVQDVIEIAKDPGLVETSEKAIGDIINDVQVDATNPNDTSKIAEVATIVTGLATGLGAGIINAATVTATVTDIASGGKQVVMETVRAIDQVREAVDAFRYTKDIANIVTNAGRVIGGAAIVTLPVLIAEYGMTKMLEKDAELDKEIMQKATTNATNAYIQAVQNGGTRQDALNAAREAYNQTEYIPGVSDGVINVPGTNVGDSPVAGGVDLALEAIETAVADAIRDAGGDVSDYFGGCGCDDECDCPDCGCDDSGCGSDCGSDCGCDDSGECPDCSSDGDCESDCGVDYGCSGDLGCVDDYCSSDCSSDGCSSDNIGCSSDYVGCGTDGYCDDEGDYSCTGDYS